MSKHTPGPWWLGRDPSHFGSLTSITGGSDSTGGIRSVAEVGGLDIDEAEANARLISAAPDMLEALHDVLRYCVTPSGLPDKNKGRTPEQDAAMAKAKAAIAKAEGNQ